MDTCSFCNAPKFKTVVEMTSSGKKKRTFFCKDCHAYMEESNRQHIARKEQERKERGTVGTANIHNKRGGW